jgi:AAA domain
VISGADENDAQDMGAAIAALDWLKQHFSATVLLVHHTGRNGKHERGSSVLPAAADTMIKCSNAAKGASRSSASLKCEKMKDAEEFSDLVITMKRIQINTCESSLAVTSGDDVRTKKTQSQSDDGNSRSSKAEKLLTIIRSDFRTGGTHRELQDRFLVGVHF